MRVLFFICHLCNLSENNVYLVLDDKYYCIWNAIRLKQVEKQTEKSLFQVAFCVATLREELQQNFLKIPLYMHDF